MGLVDLKYLLSTTNTYLHRERKNLDTITEAGNVSGSIMCCSTQTLSLPGCFYATGAAVYLLEERSSTIDTTRRSGSTGLWLGLCRGTYSCSRGSGTLRY